MVIRVATIADTEYLFELNSLFNGEGCADREHIRRSLEENRNEVVCIAVEDGRAAGYCCGQQMKTMCYQKDYAEIVELFVKEEFRRQRVGEQLMALMEQEFNKRGITHFHLCTGGGNLRAQTLYEKLGFVHKGEIQYIKNSK